MRKGSEEQKRDHELDFLIEMKGQYKALEAINLN